MKTLNLISPISPVLLFILSFICGCQNSIKKTVSHNYEGYITLESKVFSDSDTIKLPMNELTWNDSIFLTVNRRMIIYNNLVIDVNKNNVFSDNKYIKTDTLSYEFYDFTSQKYISFEKMLSDSKILGKGLLTDAQCNFSTNSIEDPMSTVCDSDWQVLDPVINGDSIGVVTFSLRNEDKPEDIKRKKMVKFWVNYSVKNFPLQLSYILSRKLRNAFVYKIQAPMEYGREVMTISLSYQASKLSDSLVTLFEKWSLLSKQ
ncbi:MAG: hypothetical protein NTW29_01815 [Bacteroidetes bacterium]|nr:hypothetical protein [Bacteroidota bacterium]